MASCRRITAALALLVAVAVAVWPPVALKFAHDVVVTLDARRNFRALFTS